MVNGDSTQNMEETEVKMDEILDLAKEVLGTHKVKMKEIQHMLDSAKNNDGYSFVDLSMKVGVHYFGIANIGQVSI